MFAPRCSIIDRLRSNGTVWQVEAGNGGLTATGRAILAALPKAQVRALFPDSRSFVVRHPGADEIDRYSRLRRVLDETIVRGYSLERGSVTPGFASVGVEVLDHTGWPVAGIAATFREEEVPEDEYAALAGEDRTAAASLSARIYGRQPRIA